MHTLKEGKKKSVFATLLHIFHHCRNEVSILHHAHFISFLSHSRHFLLNRITDLQYTIYTNGSLGNNTSQDLDVLLREMLFKLLLEEYKGLLLQTAIAEDHRNEREGNSRVE